VVRARAVGSATLIAPRPKVFFSPSGEMPPSAELALTTPRGFSSAEEFQKRVATALYGTDRRSTA
jgi:hypothetical protein